MRGLPLRFLRSSLGKGLPRAGQGRHKLELLYWRNRTGVKQENTISGMTLRATPPDCTHNAALARYTGVEKAGRENRESEISLAQPEKGSNAEVIHKRWGAARSAATWVSGRTLLDCANAESAQALLRRESSAFHHLSMPTFARKRKGDFGIMKWPTLAV